MNHCCKFISLNKMFAVHPYGSNNIGVSTSFNHFNMHLFTNYKFITRSNCLSIKIRQRCIVTKSDAKPQEYQRIEFPASVTSLTNSTCTFKQRHCK